VTVNQALPQVLDGCGNRKEGTWLSTEMREAYMELDSLGHIKSYEVWDDSALVGGLYGVLVGGLFAAESMFHSETNASKVALVASVTHLFHLGVTLYDVQFMTSHLGRMGAREIPRTDYLARLEIALRATTLPSPAAEETDLLPWVETELSRSGKAVIQSRTDGH
jgi:leucyl/phenylalanyl-tRNA--protein transferase